MSKISFSIDVSFESLSEQMLYELRAKIDIQIKILQKHNYLDIKDVPGFSVRAGNALYQNGFKNALDLERISFLDLSRLRGIGDELYMNIIISMKDINHDVGSNYVPGFVKIILANNRNHH